MLDPIAALSALSLMTESARFMWRTCRLASRKPRPTGAWSSTPSSSALAARCSARRRAARRAMSAKGREGRHDRQQFERPQHHPIAPKSRLNGLGRAGLGFGREDTQPVHRGLAFADAERRRHGTAPLGTEPGDRAARDLAPLRHEAPERRQVDVEAHHGIEFGPDPAFRHAVGFEVGLVAGEQEAALTRLEILHAREEPLDVDHRLFGAVDRVARAVKRECRPGPAQDGHEQQEAGQHAEAVQIGVSRSFDQRVVVHGNPLAAAFRTGVLARPSVRCGFRQTAARLQIDSGGEDRSGPGTTVSPQPSSDVPIQTPMT